MTVTLTGPQKAILRALVTSALKAEANPKAVAVLYLLRERLR